MAVTVNWITKVISVPKADLTFIGPGQLYELDVDSFRLELKSIEADEGMPFVDTHQHNTEVTVGGVTLARVVEIINGYTIEFEDDQYAVNLVGANNNISDVSVVNQVSIRSANSAGLISVDKGQSTEIAAAVWDELMSGHKSSGTAGLFLRLIQQMVAGNVVVAPDGLSITVRDEDNATVLATFAVSADERTMTRTA